MLTDALFYGPRKFYIFPVDEKKPLIKDWPNSATLDSNQIKAWWEKWPSANIGLACGEKSGVFVIDIDIANGKQGETSLKNLPDLPETLESKTGSGGRHLFFEYPKNREIRNKQNILPGIDIRGQGGYVVLPPSLHESGNNYEWLNGNKPAECPVEILNIIAPTKKILPPWKKQQKKNIPDIKKDSKSIIDRASTYLQEVPPAIQGQAGHDSLLWAARCMVVGFELSTSDALNLLWNEYNPRCRPPWNHDNPGDVRDFERKIEQAKNLPFDKPSGWLLDNTEFQSDEDSMASILANDFAEKFISRKKDNETKEKAKTDFPLETFPEPVKKYIEKLAEVQVVNPASVALSVLVAAGSALGVSYKLRIKGGFDVSPILWGAIIARSGSNKSGPFREIIKPLRIPVPFERLKRRICNPQGQLLIEDATIEAVLDVLSNSPRGLIMANGEGAGWAGSFDRYNQGTNKKISVDETIWIKLWDCDTYQKNRKTDSENLLIYNAACSVLVCIQPKKMAEAFTPSQFASGLVPRLLLVYIPRQFRGWTEAEMTEEDSLWWKDIILKLRCLPFADQDPNTGEFFPNIINFSDSAKKLYIEEYLRLAHLEHEAPENTALFYSKSEGMIGRIALVLHGLEFACGMHEIDKNISPETVKNAIIMTRYFVDQQLTVYNLAEKMNAEEPKKCKKKR